MRAMSEAKTREMWVPGTADLSVLEGRSPLLPGQHRLVERPVMDRCRVCATPFYEGEERGMVAHLKKCLDEHREQLAAAREEEHPSIMLPWDPEHASWMKTNKTAILEGRKKC